MPTPDDYLKAQRRIDAIRYPPTMRYDLATLTPFPPLDQRVRIIRSLCPDFFRADRFLDVGASKGYFSLRAAEESGYVLAIEPDRESLDAWQPVCPTNVNQVSGSFRDLDPGLAGMFDLVWIGNGPHHLQKDEGPSWISRTIELASDRLVIEGPEGAATPCCRDWDPGTVPEEIDLLDAFGADFRLMGSITSASGTGRKVWYFRRRTDP